MHFLKRWRWIKVATLFAAIIGVLILSAPNASATGPRDAGYTSNGPYSGFTFPPAYTGNCDGYLFHRFSYEVYRIASDTVTLEFYPEGGASGKMYMWAQGDTRTYVFTVVNSIPQGYVGYWHVQSFGHYHWYFQWHDEGASQWCTKLTSNAP